MNNQSKGILIIQRILVALFILAALTIIGVGVWLSLRPSPGLVQGMADADSLRVAAKITAPKNASAMSGSNTMRPMYSEPALVIRLST